MDIDTSVETQLQQQQLRQRLDRLARVLDTAFRIPGTRIRFGADALIGLVPGVGDVAGLALGLWLIWQARGVQAPAPLQMKMLGNLGIETLLGIVPVLGDAFDVLWQANQRNRQLLINWMDEQARLQQKPPPRPWPLILVGGLLLALLLLGVMLV